MPARPSAAPSFALRVTYLPVEGKAGELRATLEERMRAGGPGVIGSGLSAQVAPPEGPALGLTILFASLAGMDEFRAGQTKDPTFPAFVAKVDSLTRGPGGQ